MPGITFLFWNLNGQPLEPRVARITAARGVDVLILAECETSPAGVLTALAGGGGGHFHEADSSCTRLRVFSRLPRKTLRFQFVAPHQHYLLYRVVPATTPELLLVVAHLPSKIANQPQTQEAVAGHLAADVNLTEDRRGHRRTVLVGDLNMNPFEAGVAGVTTLHGVSARAVADRGERLVAGRRYRLFYNPMWGFFGDRTPGPPGTYYRSAGDAVNYFWNIYDQLLIRPDLADHLRDLMVLETDGVESLLTPNGLPDRASGSDHLPVFFRLEW